MEVSTMTHVSLDTQPEAVKQFILGLTMDPGGVVLALNNQPVACILPPPKVSPEQSKGTVPQSTPPTEFTPKQPGNEPVPAEHVNVSPARNIAVAFTPTQGRYLAFIHTYTTLHGYPPAELEIAKALCVSPPSVNQMVKMLERKGLIQRQPGQPRSLKVLVPEDQIPPWHNRRTARTSAPSEPAQRPAAISAAPPGNLYVLWVLLRRGPISDKFTKKEISRTIEIRGDQTLEQLHNTIFQAYDRHDQHLYEFQFGKRPYDPDGPNYGVGGGASGTKQAGDARMTKLDDLGLTKDRVFGYWFDFGDDWFHQIQVMRIEQAIPTVTYPRIIKRVGKSPPQYLEED